MFKDLRENPVRYVVTGCVVVLGVVILRSIYPFDSMRFALNVASGLGYTTAGVAIAEMLYQYILLGRRFGWKSTLGLGCLFGTVAIVSIARLALEFRVGFELLR